MTGIPKNPSAAFVKLNPHLFGERPEPVATFRAQTPISTFVIDVEPCPAPRMTRRDKWLKPRRVCVQRYFDYRDSLRATVGDVPTVPGELRATLHFTMPESWSNKKREAMDGKPHRQRPDGDNCMKAIQDALFLEDGGVWKGTFEKRWAKAGRVEIVMGF